jgi:deoxycytidylate deaminase
VHGWVHGSEGSGNGVVRAHSSDPGRSVALWPGSTTAGFGAAMRVRPTAASTVTRVVLSDTVAPSVTSGGSTPVAAEADATQPNTELFLAVVGPIGADLRLVCGEIERGLSGYGYTTSHIRLSSFFSELTWDPARSIPEEPYDEQTWAGMDAGNALRQKWGRDDALALLGIGKIEEGRVARAKERGVAFDPKVGAPAIDRRAFVIRSLKTPGEVLALRDVYGPRFFLIGAHCAEPMRLENLRRAIGNRTDGKQEAEWTHAPSQLVNRDWSEEEEGGQNVRGTFHESDFFIDAHDEKSIRRDLDRLLRILFGYPYATPTREEYAMFQATGAARRSAELSRQVGAAVASREGSILSLGTNEVPAFGGGSYWEGDPNDQREFNKAKETNTEYRERMAAEIERLIGDRFDSAAETARRLSGAQARQLRDRLLKGLPDVVLETKVGDVTEYGRATHAEMSALLDAAQRGVPVQGSTLFTTTFPCHNCARHIIEAGVERVVFIEPYAKSQALSLHADAMELVAAHSSMRSRRRVQFEPFVGVAPRRYLELFDALSRERWGHPKRKNKRGEPLDFDGVRATATPVFSDLEQKDLRPTVPIYRHRERRVVDLLKDLFDRTKLGLKEN